MHTTHWHLRMTNTRSNILLVIGITAMITVAVVSVMIVTAALANTLKTSQENQCILRIPPIERTQAQIDKCLK